jgi:hypothetical protein
MAKTWLRLMVGPLQFQRGRASPSLVSVECKNASPRSAASTFGIPFAIFSCRAIKMQYLRQNICFLLRTSPSTPTTDNQYFGGA